MITPVPFCVNYFNVLATVEPFLYNQPTNLKEWLHERGGCLNMVGCQTKKSFFGEKEMAVNRKKVLLIGWL